MKVVKGDRLALSASSVSWIIGNARQAVDTGDLQPVADPIY